MNIASIAGMKVSKSRDGADWVIMYDIDGYGVDVRVTGIREPSKEDMLKGVSAALDMVNMHRGFRYDSRRRTEP